MAKMWRTRQNGSKALKYGASIRMAQNGKKCATLENVQTCKNG